MRCLQFYFFRQEGASWKKHQKHVWKLWGWKWKITQLHHKLIRGRAWPLNTERVILEVVLSEQSQHTELRWVPGNNNLILQTVNLVKPGLFWTHVIFSYLPNTITSPKALYDFLLTSAVLLQHVSSHDLSTAFSMFCVWAWYQQRVAQPLLVSTHFSFASLNFLSYVQTVFRSPVENPTILHLRWSS